MFLFALFRIVIKRRIGSVGMAFILVGTIIAWNMLVYWLTYAVPWLQKVLEPPPLLTKLRENGITDPRQVDKAYMEPDGQVTVLKKEEL